MILLLNGGSDKPPSRLFSLRSNKQVPLLRIRGVVPHPIAVVLSKIRTLTEPHNNTTAREPTQFCRGAPGLVGMLNEVPGAAKHGLGPPEYTLYSYIQVIPQHNCDLTGLSYNIQNHGRQTFWPGSY